MLNRTRLILAVLLAVSFAPAAFAQQPSPELQAYGTKLMAEIGSSLQCAAGNITLRGQVDALNAEVKRLKDKYEPAKPIELAPEPAPSPQ